MTSAPPNLRTFLAISESLTSRVAHASSRVPHGFDFQKALILLRVHGFTGTADHVCLPSSSFPVISVSPLASYVAGHPAKRSLPGNANFTAHYPAFSVRPTPPHCGRSPPPQIEPNRAKSD